MDLALVDMRWTSDEGVRCGRVDAAIVAEGAVDACGGVLGDVVEIARMVVVGWWFLHRRCDSTGKGVVANLRVGDFVRFIFWIGGGHDKRCDGLG